MARTGTTNGKKSGKAEAKESDAFRLRRAEEAPPEEESEVHVLAPGIICDTEARGHATPRGLTPAEIVVDASEGFVPLWAPNVMLRWRFQERSMKRFADPEAAKGEIRKLLGDALLQWGGAAPIKFTEDDDVWDFEIVMRAADQCQDGGCVLASAFFPDSGRHQLKLYPRMFTQSRKEQVDTLIHEIGHIFGLRHFFANVSETAWPSQIFGKHSKFSIMNYGNLSALTADDKKDLGKLYQAAWSGVLTNVNGTAIRFVQPFHALGAAPGGMVAAAPNQAVLQAQATVAYPTEQ